MAGKHKGDNLTLAENLRPAVNFYAKTNKAYAEGCETNDQTKNPHVIGTPEWNAYFRAVGSSSYEEAAPGGDKDVGELGFG